MIIKLLIVIIIAAVAILLVWRFRDHQADAAEMRRLISLQPTDPESFSISMVADLPEPARRYFKFTIAEGTLLSTVAKIEMTGQFSLGNKADPNYIAMTATQVLAPSEGFVWKMSGGKGLMRMSGSDSAHWTRFWLTGLFPVARFGGDPDHKRSAYGRYVAEASIWAPAALLPGPGIRWEALDNNSARVIIHNDEFEQAVDVTVNEHGQPVEIQFQRWSNANPNKVHRLQPFGAFVSDFRDVGGFQLPFHVEAGNQFGTDGYFPFFIAEVREIQFPKAGL